MFDRIVNVALNFPYYLGRKAINIKEKIDTMRIKMLKRRETTPKAKIAPAEWQEFIEI